MEYRMIQPRSGFWLEYKLDKPLVDWLWERIDEAKGNESVKEQLAGNITESLPLEDKEGKFNAFLKHHVLSNYIETLNKWGWNDGLTPRHFQLTSLWVNFQNKHEFNPSHKHHGKFSFVIWMKIPTDWREQHNLPILNGVSEPRASDFEFAYTNMLGTIKHHIYKLDPSMEGTMLFFPAELYHQVYPFYECDEERISISGNVWIAPPK